LSFQKAEATEEHHQSESFAEEVDEENLFKEG
jgi:hypothetical protein